ncbi:MAG: secretin and TonB N-terminal domain-containing protein [Sphingobacteriales bacterium]
MRKIILVVFIFLGPFSLLAQQNRIPALQRKLDSLSRVVPGLNQKVQLQVNGSLQQYLAGISSSNNLSISVDPKLSFIVNDTFNDVSALNILVFLAQKYNLDISVVGNIIYVTQYEDPARFIKPPPKEIKATYNAANNTLSLSLDNDSLTSVAKKITEVSGKNVIVPNSLLSKKVSGFFAAAAFEPALEKLAYTNGLKMVKTSDNFYLFQPLEENEELYVNGDRSTSTRRTFKPAAPTGGGNTGLYIKTVNGQKLIYADAVNAPLSELVKQASQELNKSYSLYSDLKGTITIHVKDVSYEDFLSLLFKGTDYTFHTDNDVYLIGDRKLEGLRTYEMVQLQHRSLDTILSLIPADWKKGIEIKEFREQNSLLLSGSGEQIHEVKDFIKKLDVLVPVVLIEVTIIDINKNRTVSTGIALGVGDSTKKTGGTILPGVDFTFSSASVNSFLSSVSKSTGINLGHVVPNFYASISALETSGDVNVRSIPKLSALNGHTASLSIGSSIYYKNTTQNVIPSSVTSQSIFSNVYVESDANMEIAIKPVVSGDEQVTLGIRISISDFTSIPTDGSPPPKSTSKFETSLRVSNGETLVLGGIERTEQDDSVTGTPVLSRIPLLKYLFSSKTKSTKKVVSVLFIKPTIIR